MKCIKFKKGNDVKWASQAGGHVTYKRGEIVAVVGAGAVPDATKYPGLKVRARGARNFKSFIVFVKRNGRHYWPWPSALRKV